MLPPVAGRLAADPVKIEQATVYRRDTRGASFRTVGWFSRPATPPAPPLEAAAATVALATGLARPAFGTVWGTGYGRMAPVEFAPATDVWSRDVAMSIPTISRARDLICSAVAGLPLTLWTVSFDTDRGDVHRRLPPPPWMTRPDPDRTRQWLLAWTCDDLLFSGRAYWRVIDRTADTYPSKFRYMAAGDVSVDNDGRVRYLGKEIPATDVIEFLSPLDGLLYASSRPINIALNLEASAERFSSCEVPAGWLEQTDNSEPLEAAELAEMAATFAAARLSRTTAALNPYVRYHESTMDPSRLQLVEARLHQRGELANAANIPAYFVSAPAGTGMTYMNAAQAKQDLIDFGAMPHVQTIEQTLSGPNVTPRGQAVRLDVNAWLRNPYTAGEPSANDMEIAYDTADQAAADPPPAGPGRPRDVDGRNEGTPP